MVLNPIINIIDGLAKNSLLGRPLRLTLYRLPQVPISGRPVLIAVTVQPTHVPFPSIRLQSFIIFVGMCSIALFRPWMKEEAGQVKKEVVLPSDNKYLYIMPSLLDVLGTIVDTTGLFYVNLVRFRPAFRLARC